MNKLVLLMPAFMAAAGFQILEQNSTYMGQAYAGTAASWDNSSAAYYNPAALTKSQNYQLSFSGALLRSRTEYFLTDSLTARSESCDDLSAWSAIPTIYLSKNFHGKYAVGLAIVSPFGLSTRYSNESIVKYVAIDSSLKTFMISPSLVYQLQPELSLAFGVDYTIAKITLSKYSYLNQSLYTNNLHDWNAWGWHFGALYDYSSKTTFGLRLNSSIKLKMDGTISPAYYDYSDVRSECRSPEVLVFSVKHDLDKRNSLLLDLERTHWSRFDSLDLIYTATGSPDVTTSYEYNYDDSWRCALGYTYGLAAATKIRFGAAYDQTPSSDTFRKANIPDESRSWLSIGFTREVSNGSFDFSYAFVKMAKAKLNQTESLIIGSVNSTLTGSYSSHVHIMGMQWNKSWK